MAIKATPTSEAAVTRAVPSARPRRGPSKLVIYLARLALVAVVIAAWQLTTSNGWLSPTTYGHPSGIWTAIVHYLPSSKNFVSLGATGEAVLYTFVIGSVLGTLVGLILGLTDTLNEIIGPFLAPINSIPRIALAPLFIAWFGLTTTAKVVLGVSIVFFILAENARASVRSVDHDVMTMARVVGLGKAAILWKVVLPSAVPTIIAGLRLTFTYSLLGVIASEMIAATHGVGQDIVLYSSSFQINTVFAIILELVVIAVAVNWLFTAVERRLLVWQQT